VRKGAAGFFEIIEARDQVPQCNRQFHQGFFHGFERLADLLPELMRRGVFEQPFLLDALDLRPQHRNFTGLAAAVSRFDSFAVPARRKNVPVEQVQEHAEDPTGVQKRDQHLSFFGHGSPFTDR